MKLIDAQVREIGVFPEERKRGVANSWELEGTDEAGKRRVFYLWLVLYPGVQKDFRTFDGTFFGEELVDALREKKRTLGEDEIRSLIPLLASGVTANVLSETSEGER